ncbi:gamma subclass chorismate mutase AroQ [Pseudomonas sp. NPDC090755]|uniref:gamma subclass chorismate mutase AroQ n=1 Tax=Pseudomonas sp. NPDC090755 TaxID=3364481 RepID=UPI00383AAB02
MRLTLLLFSLLLTQGCAPSPSDPLQRLLDSVEQRLDLAETIALSKWQSGQLVEDPSREQQVIANAEALAPSLKLSSQRAAEFMAAQIRANKVLQLYALADWQATGNAPKKPRVDLTTQVRPQLDQLQQTLLSELARFDRNPPEPCYPTVTEAIAQRELDETREMALKLATYTLCTAP